MKRNLWKKLPKQECENGNCHIQEETEVNQGMSKPPFYSNYISRNT